MEALAEQAPGMRRRAVIMRRQRPRGFVGRAQMAQIAALRGIAGQRTPLQRDFLGARLDHVLAAAFAGKAIGEDLPTGKIVSGEVLD